MKLRALLDALLKPSLARRLVLAQAGLLALLWLGLIGSFVYDVAYVNEWYEPKEMQERADMILAVVDNLADRPERLANALVKIDEFQRDEHRERDEPGVRVTMNVWDGDELLYMSPGEPGVVTTTTRDALEISEQHGRRIRTFARASANSDAHVTLIMPGDGMTVFLTLWADGIVLLPLLVSMPLLLLPAWLAVRYALRPFRELSNEVERKGPGDLAPLAFRAQHRELRSLVTSVNGLLERLRSSMSRERRFIADAAHELRTPLAAMRINVEALAERAQNPADKPLLQGLLSSGDRATRLVSQLLSLMRSEAGAVDAGAERVDLSELVEERVAALAGIARHRRVELELDAPPPSQSITARREGVISLVDNLVENAIKYSPAGSTVLVGVHTHDGRVELTVTDAGPGIPDKFRDRVFERFFRSPDQAQTGSGLGLAIVRSVADSAGASVSLEEADGGGLRVRVDFRRAE